MTSLQRIVGAMTAAMLLAGCAGVGGLGSIQATQQLRQGMTPAEVQQLLGPPGSTQNLGDATVWRYSLHEYFKGYVPHYLAFAGDPPVLRAWVANEEEYLRNQAMWAQALEPLVTPATSSPGSSAPGATGGQGDSCEEGTVEDRVECLQVELIR